MVKHMRGTSNKREILGTRVCMSGEMSSLEDIFSTNQCPTDVFTSQGTDVTPHGDRGVCKIVKRHGVEGEKPMIGDRVYVHYTGRLLNGKKFDSSLDRKEPFVFNVGKGQVIKAWDISVCSMQKGEVCLMLCKPEYAYGSAGSPPKVPPNATLVFEIELLSFRGEELTEDGGIVRRIKVKGEGYYNPNEGATVHVHLEGSCGGHSFDSRDVTFVVGESEDVGVPLGVDRAMEKIQKGECCLLYLKPKYGYGKEGKKEYDIGSNAELLYEVTLKDFEKAGRYNYAVIQYQRIINWLEMECGAGKEQQEAIQALLLVAHLNLALCFLRLREYSQTVENCNKVMELDPENEKALYRRGEARLLRNEFSMALIDFKQVLQVNTFNRAARSQIAVCQRKIREHHERDKKIYANMFQRFAEHDAKMGRLKRKKEESGISDQNKQGLKRPCLSQDGS
ncbi:peptidyl-prolyl cis-trans isomerase FKBP5 isoform X2 [Puntigrus tetrazona]|uniref:peptidyl-prolyl cis-trans isomerase FKBP5 isoform X2 n=1 Tax=Puntigrus tetrazona TaxID=1606681 RepID=UPI001C891798|nr:peptidyl-prolyl cis-trans isomerase FKBP5 isoform X2 [Puntigrus tetrazona]